MGLRQPLRRSEGTITHATSFESHVDGNVVD